MSSVWMASSKTNRRSLSVTPARDCLQRLLRALAVCIGTGGDVPAAKFAMTRAAVVRSSSSGFVSCFVKKSSQNAP